MSTSFIMIYMLTIQKFIHIVLISIFSVNFVSLTIQLGSSELQAILFILQYCVLLFIQSIKTYSIFHCPPSQPAPEKQSNSLDLVFSLKLNQEKRRDLEHTLRSLNKMTIANLQQYAEQYSKNSFCDICEKMQPSRCNHCFYCESCILGQQKHCKMVGFCIGSHNQKEYLSYLMSSKVIFLYQFVGLSYFQFFNQSKYHHLTVFFEILFHATQITLFVFVLLYGYKFIQIFNAINQNKTISEQRNPFLNTLTYPTKHQISYWQCIKDLFMLQKVGDDSLWMNQLQQYDDRS